MDWMDCLSVEACKCPTDGWLLLKLLTLVDGWLYTMAMMMEMIGSMAWVDNIPSYGVQGNEQFVTLLRQ